MMSFLRKLLSSNLPDEVIADSVPQEVSFGGGHAAHATHRHAPELKPAYEALFPFDVGAVSDRGVHRSENEDTIFCFESVLCSEPELSPFGLFIMADGLGGHEDGKAASELTVRTVASYLLKAVFAPLVSGQGQDSESVPLNDSLLKAVELANRAVRQGTRGGGSTLTLVILLDRTAYVAHVGDSRAYLVAGDSITQLTQDHSLSGRLMEIQGLTEDEVSQLPERHTLYKALGQPATPDPDIRYYVVSPGTHLLLCSDGLWSFVPQQDILDALASSTDSQATCRQLANLAMAYGSDDNVSVILLLGR